MLILFLVLAFSTTRAAMAAEKPEKLRIAYITISGSMAALWMAAATGEFQKEALAIELVYIQANAAIAAVLAAFA